MKTQVIVKELEEVTRLLGMTIRKEKGSFKGGQCVVEGKNLVVLNKLHSPEFHLSVLAECLRDLPLDNVFLKPAVRKALEEAWDASEITGSDEDPATMAAENLDFS